MGDQLSQDTAPQPAVDLPIGAALAGSAAGGVSSVLLARSVVAAVAGLLLATVAVLLFCHGVRADHFPPYLPSATSTVITRYSAPWISGSAGALLLSGMCFSSFGVDVFRRLRLQRARQQA